MYKILFILLFNDDLAENYALSLDLKYILINIHLLFIIEYF